MRFAFLSRHQPTKQQEVLADFQEIQLVSIGDKDAFTVSPEDIKAHGDFDGVVVVHPAAAMNLRKEYHIGIFKNAARPPVGAPIPSEPQFESLRIWCRG